MALCCCYYYFHAFIAISRINFHLEKTFALRTANYRQWYSAITVLTACRLIKIKTDNGMAEFICFPYLPTYFCFDCKYHLSFAKLISPVKAALG